MAQQLPDIVTLVVRHRVRPAQLTAYEAWLRRTIGVAEQFEGHLGVNVMRSQDAGLTRFTIALLCASATLIVGMLATLRLTLPVTEAEDIAPSLHWPVPIPPREEDSDRGPVMVTLEYSINRADVEQFTLAMQDVRAMHRRSGALTWGLVQNTENPDSWLEFFIDGSWLEHMRHHGRVTKADRRIESAARRFQQPGVELVIKHHLMHVARR